jgi:hypothetical protein
MGFGALSGVIHGEKRGRAVNMAQERGEKRPECSLFNQTNGNQKLKPGIICQRISAMFDVWRKRYRDFA